MSEEIDLLIESKEAELLPFRSRMEELRAQFTQETIRFTADWYEVTAKEYVMKYPQATLSMSAEKIALMKSKINNVVRNTENNVKKQLGNPELWWHEKPHLHDSIDRYKQVGDRYPEVLDKAVRRALGCLGMVLEDFGFNVSASGSTISYHEFWFESLVGAQAIPSYPHLLKWTKAMEGILREYDGHYQEAMGLYNEIFQLKEEKKRQEALTLWNSV